MTQDTWDKFGIVLVADNSGGDWNNILLAPNERFRVFHVSDPFIFARNVNLAWKSCEDEDYVVIMGDDVKPFTVNFLWEMKAVMDNHPKLGMLSPGIVSPNKLAMIGEYEFWGRDYITGHYSIPFICVMIRQAVWKQIGFLDERYTGYGYDDDDYNVRMINAEWEVGHTCRALIRHGDGEQTLGISFLKQYGSIENLEKQAEINRVLYESKYDVHEDGDILNFKEK
jgi:hypothetical protein